MRCLEYIAQKKNKKKVRASRSKEEARERILAFPVWYRAAWTACSTSNDALAREIIIPILFTIDLQSTNFPI